MAWWNKNLKQTHKSWVGKSLCYYISANFTFLQNKINFVKTVWDALSRNSQTSNWNQDPVDNNSYNIPPKKKLEKIKVRGDTSILVTEYILSDRDIFDNSSQVTINVLSNAEKAILLIFRLKKFLAQDLRINK